MSERSSASWLVRQASSMVLVGGVVIFAIQLFRALSPNADRVALGVDAFVIIVAFLGLSAGLQGIARLIAGQGGAGQDQALLNLMEQIRAAVDQLPGNIAGLSALTGADDARRPERAPAAAPLPAELTEALARITALLEEIRELSLLDEPQRRQRLQEAMQRRKLLAIAQAQAAIEAGRWGQAERLIAACEADFAGDEQVGRLRVNLTQGRAAVEEESIRKIKARVEDLMAISSWDEAYKLAEQLAQDYQGNAEAAAMLGRVRRERDLFNENTVQQIYEEIKKSLERRQWRQALAGARRLVEQFPEHPKTVKVRVQLKTIQDNAEIEERQEQEARIQELLRAKRFAEAIALAEDVLSRYPTSPQAESLGRLLPKMRELAIAAGAAIEGR